MITNYKDHVFTLCPSHGGLEWAEYVCLEVHCTDMLSDSTFGVVYVPISDFTIDEEEKIFRICHTENGKNSEARLCIRFKRLWSVPMSSSAASVHGNTNIIQSSVNENNESNEICQTTPNEILKNNGNNHNITENNINDNISRKSDGTYTENSSDENIFLTPPGPGVGTGININGIPKKYAGVVENVGKGIYNGVTGGIGLAGDIGIGIAGGVGLVGGLAGGIGSGIIGGIAGGIVGGIGIAGNMVGIKGAPEPVGVITLRCLLKESSEYFSMWPAEGVLAGALRDNSSAYTVENFCVAPGYEGLVLQGVSENDFVFNRRLKPISFVTDIFNLGTKVSSNEVLGSKSANDGTFRKRVSFTTPTKQMQKDEKQMKKDQKNVKKEEKRSLALLELNENERIKKSKLLAEYVAQVEENEKKIGLLEKQNSKSLMAIKEGNKSLQKKNDDSSKKSKDSIGRNDLCDDSDEESENHSDEINDYKNKMRHVVNKKEENENLSVGDVSELEMDVAVGSSR